MISPFSSISPFGHPRFVGGGAGFALISHTFAAGLSNLTTPAISTIGANLIVIGVASYVGVAAPTISDSEGNTYTPGTALTNSPFLRAQIYYCANPTVGASHTFTATGATIIGGITVAAFSGAGASPFDQENGDVSNSQTFVNCGSVTPSVDNELLVAFYDGDEPTSSLAISSGYTITDIIPHSAGNNFGFAMAYEIQTAATTENPQWTWTPLIDGAIGRVATFKPA